MQPAAASLSVLAPKRCSGHRLGELAVAMSAILRKHRPQSEDALSQHCALKHAHCSGNVTSFEDTWRKPCKGSMRLLRK